MSRILNASDYDKEFAYAPEIEEQVPELMRQMAQEPRLAKTSQQTWEEYYRLHEENVEMRKKYRWVQQDEFKLQRQGKILHMNEFLRLLKSAGLNATYSEKGGMPKTLALSIDGKYLCFVQVPMMQEYEEVFFDEYDVPLGCKRRGWRTVVLRLIEAGYLNESQAIKTFGEPASGPVSRRYRAYLQYLRSIPK
jgi:hypothetical protein